MLSLISSINGVSKGQSSKGRFRDKTEDHLADEFWRDVLGGEWICSVAGTPGTWKQIRPVAVTVDPASGTIPTGYLIWNAADGALKRHAGGYSWEIGIGADALAK
ncbi:hypothetical protein N8703_05455 [Verrucomicrobia bacterium]|nr:hypothetical protein [Verrucomicrobiota bacterium]